MALSFKKIWTGLTIVAKAVLTSDTKGEMEVDSTSGKLNYHNGASRSPVVTESHSAVLTNKSIDADNSTITNLETDNLKSGVLNTSTTIAGATNTQIPSALAVKTYVDDKISGQNEASEITFVPYLTIAATNVQDAIEEVYDDVVIVGDDLGAHVIDPTDAHDASAISSVPAGNLAATDVQGALNELQSDIDGRQPTITGAATTITSADLTASRAVISNASGKVAVSTVTDTELGYVSGVTSAIQTQINGKQGTLTNSAGLAAALSDETGNGLAVFNNQPTITNASIQTPSRADVKQDTYANLVTYASSASNGQLCFATDTKTMYQVVDLTLVSVGSSAGGFDSFVNLDASELLSTWTTGDNATFLGGGTLAGTFVKETSSPLNGNASYKYTQAASSLDDYIASPVQSVPVRFRGNQASLIFPYTYDGTSSDIEPIVYDVTNSTKLTTATNLLPSTGTNTSIYKANVSIPITCTQIRIGFQVKALNSAKILSFDDVQVSADTTRYADFTEMTDWVTASFSSLVWNGLGTVTSLIQMRRVGSSLKLRGKWTNGTVTGTTVAIPLPLWNGTQLTSSSTINASDSGGHILRAQSAVNQYYNVIIDPSVTTVGLSQATVSNAADPSTKVTGTAAFATGVTYLINGELTIPIQGWVSSNPNIVTASESFSTDTASLTYASSAAYTLSTLVNAPVGTLITYTYAINSNTRTQTTTAPTQTTADMNVNGIQLFTRAYNAASTAASPAVVAIQIGKGLKGVSRNLYQSTGKVNAGSIDIEVHSATNQNGVALKEYNEQTGILLLDAGYCHAVTVTTSNLLFSDLSSATSGYLVINASKSPALVGVPQVQPRFATISDVKASGTVGGTGVTGSFQTRTLNTLSDSTGIVTSLASNQFTLSAGTYFIEASAPAYRVSFHKAKLRNITDSTDAIIGSSEEANNGVNALTCTRSIISGEVVITASKVFEIQHRIGATSTTQDLGPANSFAVSEVYTIVKITKVK